MPSPTTAVPPTLQPPLDFSLTEERGIHIIKDPEGRLVQAHTNPVEATVAWDYLRIQHNDAYWLFNGGYYDETVSWTLAAAPDL